MAYSSLRSGRREGDGMSEHAAIYSLIQYCPVLARAEGVNVGLVIVCADLNAVRFQFSTHNVLVQQRFGPTAFDDQRLTSAKLALAARLARLPADESAFRQWLGSEAGKLVFHEPRPLVVRDLEQDLARLFRDLVEEVPLHPASSLERPSVVSLTEWKTTLSFAYGDTNREYRVALHRTDAPPDSARQPQHH
jgi:hypothetical protein